jgi:hypothetical protein
MRRLLLFFFVMGLVIASVVSAQDGGGQLWVNAFEDRDGDGTRDPNEPFITRGVSVDLLDANGVVVASALLDESPNASRGLIGFQRLSPGTYTVIVTGADWTPTTADTFTQTLEANVMPTVLWYGAQRPAAEVPVGTPTTATIDGEIVRIAVSLLGAVIVMGAFSVIGFVIYLLAFARRAPKASTTTTGSMRPVSMKIDETGEIRKTRG